MATKLRQDFEITYPLKHKAIESLKIVTKQEGVLILVGTAYCDPSVSVLEEAKGDLQRFAVDIDYIRFKGMDIKPVLKSTGGLDDIEEFAIKQCPLLFNQKLAEVAV